MAEQNAFPAEPSMADIRGMMSAEKPDVPVEREPAEPTARVKEPEVETPLPAAAGEQQHPESIEETEPEVELTPGERKRIQQEVNRTLEIRKAISERKAAQAELDKLPAKPGSQPEPTSVAVKPEPVEPLETDPKYAGDDGFALFRADERKYRADHREWLTAEIERKTTASVEARFRQQQAQSTRAAFVENGVKAHGAEFKQHLATLDQMFPDDMVAAVNGATKDTALVVNYLGKNPAEAKALVEEFSKNPWGVIAELGRLEERLKTAAKQSEAEAEPEKARPILPNPIRRVGGGAAAHDGAVDFEKASMATVTRELNRLTKKAG